jgi:hypothetical protein
MKKTQRKIISVSYLYMWYRFMLIYINFNFDFLVLSPPHTSAFVARTCYSWQVGSTIFPRVRATFMAFSSFVTCKPNIKHVWYFLSFVTKKFSCAASKRQARLNRKICACVQLAELKTRHELVILIRHVFFNSASCTHAQIFLFRRACRLLAAHENFMSRMTKNIKHVWYLVYISRMTKMP